MIISIHQPAYLPWLGYFERINQSDLFIYLDTVQLEKNSYTYRNKIKTPQGNTWLTIPLRMKGHTSNTIRDIVIDNSQQWKKKHLKNIFFNYKKAPFFDELYPKIESLYKEEFDLFSDLTYHHLLFWLKELNINTKIVKSSDMNLRTKKSNLILDYCKIFEANKYLSGSLGRGYLDEHNFKENNIEIKYQNFKYVKYQQMHGDFIPNLSIIDYWMNCHDLSFMSPNKILVLRRAEIGDCQQYFEWVNDNLVRDNSILTQNIDWKDHQQWFKCKLNNENSFLYLLEDGLNKIGQVRFDCRDDIATIDYSISKEHRGCGHGKTIVEQALDEINNCFTYIKTINAIVKMNNIASHKVLLGLNFYEYKKEKEFIVYRLHLGK